MKSLPQSDYVFRCGSCGNVFMCDKSGLCSCPMGMLDGSYTPHPPGWTVVEGIPSGKVSWICGDCMLAGTSAGLVVEVRWLDEDDGLGGRTKTNG